MRISALMASFFCVLFFSCSDGESGSKPPNDGYITEHDTDTMFPDARNDEHVRIQDRDSSDADVISSGDGDSFADRDVLATDSDNDAAETCLSSPVGVYQVSGEDERGRYTGQAEIRDDGSFSRTITYEEYMWKGFHVAHAASGIAAMSDGNFSLEMTLKRSGYVYAAGNMVRSEVDQSSSVMKTGIVTLACDSAKLNFSGGTGNFSETWTHLRPSGDTPLWRNSRMELPVHAEPTPAEKAGIRESYKSFHDLATVQPYTDDPLFKKMVHYMVKDLTDHTYLRDHPATIRVIQRVITPLSLAEAQLRAEAYHYSLADKDAYFSEEIDEIQINDLGMVAHWNPDQQRYEHDGDALLWTGVYVAALAQKYMVTGDQTVLEKMLHSLNGIIRCIEIVPGSDDFGRTLRYTVNDGHPEFHEGTGEFEGIEYKEGGNNDMAKGIYISYLWAWKVLSQKPEYASYVERMIVTLTDLRKSNNIVKDQRNNQLQADVILLAMIENKPEYISDKYLYKNDIDLIWKYVKEYFNQGSYLINKYGVSDWSGNHLGMWTMYNLLEGFTLLGDGTRAQFMKEAMEEANDTMHYTRQGFFQIVTGHLGLNRDENEIADGTDRLREIPLHRGVYPVDHTLHPDYCISPIPELFWKHDWTENNRIQSIRAYPLFELAPSNYYWKDNLFQGTVGGTGRMNSGLDFFAVYWFLRYNNLVSEKE